MSIENIKRYSKKDFLSYASGFNYQIDIDEGNITGFKNDDEIKQAMKKWKIEDFRDFYAWTDQCLTDIDWEDTFGNRFLIKEKK